MSLITRSAAIVAVAAALAVAMPLAADAAPSPYPVLKPDTWAWTIAPNTVVTHDVPDGVFDQGAQLQLAVTGDAPAPTLAQFAASQLGSPMVSSAGGGAVIRLDFGATTTGVYDVTLTEQGSDHTSYGVVTVIPAVAAASTTGSDALTAAASLARTGTRIAGGVIWAAGAAIVAGAVIWLVSATRRRRARATD